MAELDRAHARLGPSGWDRWSTCPGAPTLEDQFEDVPSWHAAEGTVAHHVREQCLREDRQVREFVGERIDCEGFTFTVEPEWVLWLQPGIDRLREEGDELLIEQQVDLSPWIEGGFGTADAVVLQETYAVIDDLKFGRGVVVSAERNGQAMLYALGVWHELLRYRPAIERVLLRIDQPRIPGRGSEWWCTIDELLQFGELAAAAAKRTEDPDAPLVVTPKGCQFCKVAANAACPQLHAFMVELLGFDPKFKEAAQMPAIDQLTAEKRSYVIQHASLARQWLDAVYGLQLEEALAGQPTPGFKAVATSGNRVWRDPDEAEAFWLGKLPKRDVYSFKLRSPAQMELIVGTRNWRAAQDLIIQPPGRPALAPESDPRPALEPTVDLLDDLDDLTGEPSEAAVLEDTLDDLI